MKNFTYYLRFLAVLFIGSLIMSSCSDNSTEVEEDASKPASKPSFNYSDYTYDSSKGENQPVGAFVRRKEQKEKFDLWQISIGYRGQTEKDDVLSINMYFTLPHSEEIDKDMVILPGYYPLVKADMSSDNLKLFKLYCDTKETDQQSYLALVDKMNNNQPEPKFYYPTQGELYIREFRKQSFDFEIRYIFDDHNPFYSNINSLEIESLYPNWEE